MTTSSPALFIPKVGLKATLLLPYVNLLGYVSSVVTDKRTELNLLSNA